MQLAKEISPPATERKSEMEGGRSRGDIHQEHRGQDKINTSVFYYVNGHLLEPISFSLKRDSLTKEGGAR